jgi:3-oxoacyl-[acyl-carrier-protein] synthase-1
MTTAARVSIVGFSGCTSLGYSLAASLAALGAGLSNFSDTGLKNAYGTTVSAAALLERDLPRAERLARLTNLGLTELQGLLSRVGVASAPLMLGLPGNLEPEETAALRAELQRNEVVNAEPAWYPYGRASAFLALEQAVDLIGSGAHRFIVIGGIDSLCATATVYGLVQAERVLGPHTEGTIPGEAAAFALLALADDPVVDPSCSVLLEGVARHKAEPFTTADRVRGDGLASVFRALREGGAQRVDRVVAAHSGEGYFGTSFAHAYLREVDVMPEPLLVDLLADCVGDVGAAAGPLGLAFGMYLLATDPRSTRGRALVYSESDTGELGAAIIEGTPMSWDSAAAP